MGAGSAPDRLGAGRAGVGGRPPDGSSAPVEKLGGKRLGYWHTFGKHDGVLIVEMLSARKRAGDISYRAPGA